jgi:acetyl esterase/lipase
MRTAALLVGMVFGAGTLVAPSATADTSSATSASTTGYTTVIRNYGGSPLQRLTAYVPSTPGLKPAILFVHGGCWGRGSVKTREKQFAQMIMKQTGYVVAVMSYRTIAPRYLHQPQDVAAALRLLQKSPIFAVAPGRVAVWGESAGAQLALLNAYAGRGAPRIGRPAAVVSVSGPSDMATAYGGSSRRVCFSAFEGGAPTSKRMLVRYERTSGINYVDGTDPATFLVHAYADRRVAYEQSSRLAQRLKLKHVPYRLVSLMGGDHAASAEYNVSVGSGGDRVYQMAIRFLSAHL